VVFCVFFAKIRKKHAKLDSFLAGLLFSKPIFVPKTGEGLGLFGFDWV